MPVRTPDESRNERMASNARTVPPRVAAGARRAALAAALVAALTTPAESALVAGRGQLSGSGSGTVRLEGSGAFYVLGTGTLTVRDPADDASVEIRGFTYSKRLECGFRIYRGSGWVRVSGPDAMIKLDGSIDEIRVTGKGTCYLRGDGRYRVESRVRRWRERGVYLRFDLID